MSAKFDDTEAAARGILAIREIAASGLIEDMTRTPPDPAEVPRSARK
ncbi:hypothetical protein [Arthrobacter sp. NPDC093139]